MEFDHENVRLAIEEDRLSSLPDELIHHILSFIDIKYVVQTCSLSSRWRLLWTSMPCLNFHSYCFASLPEFAKFVNNVLTHRNHEVEVASVKLDFGGAASQAFVRKIANYAFSHNVHELTVVHMPKKRHGFPPCLFSSRSLKHLSIGGEHFVNCPVPKTTWNFPALTSLHLNQVKFGDDSPSKSVDIFSKCVNLKKLTLRRFYVNNVEVFDIITPRLSNLTLIKCWNFEVINLVTPQLESLTIIDCSINKMYAPPGVSSLCYKDHYHQQLSKDGFHSLNKVTICLELYRSYTSYTEEDARKTINMLQEIHSARFLTLNADIVECLSAFPDLISHHPSPFSNLISLNIDSSNRNDAYKIKISTEAKNFLLENSPSAKFTMELPEPPPTKAMKQKEARIKKNAEVVADIESNIKEFQASVEVVKTFLEKKKTINAVFENLISELQKLNEIESPIEQSEESAEMQMQVDPRKLQMNTENSKEEKDKLLAQSVTCLGTMVDLVKQERQNFHSILSQKLSIRSSLKSLPKQQRVKIESNYSPLFQESKPLLLGQISEDVSLEALVEEFEKFTSDNISTLEDMIRKYEQASQSSSSLLPNISTPSTSNINSIS